LFLSFRRREKNSGICAGSLRRTPKKQQTKTTTTPQTGRIAKERLLLVGPACIGGYSAAVAVGWLLGNLCPEGKKKGLKRYPSRSRFSRKEGDEKISFRIALTNTVGKEGAREGPDERGPQRKENGRTRKPNNQQNQITGLENKQAQLRIR